MKKVARQISYERARRAFDYVDGDLYWHRTDSGRREDMRASTNNGKLRRVVRLDGVVYQLHYLIWNWHFGETEFAVTFRDGDFLNYNITNLMQAPISTAYTPKRHRMMPREDMLPPSPRIIGGRLSLSDLKVDCPCCGQSVPNLPPNMLAINLAMRPMERRVFEAVWAAEGEPVMTERIFDKMYEDDEDGGPTPNRMYSTFKETLCSLRKKLEGSGVGIETIGYRAGYRLILGVK